MYYPITITEEETGGFVATLNYADGRFQGATEGNTREEVLVAARQMVEAVIAASVKDGDPIPPPEACTAGNDRVAIDPMLAIKVQIYWHLLASGKRKADIARFMKVNQKQVDRILDPAHRSTLRQLETAAAALGKHIEARVM